MKFFKPTGEALFRRIMAKHQKHVWRLILKRGIPESAAEDVFQEIWLGFHQRMTKGAHKEPEMLLYAIARVKIADEQRKYHHTKSQTASLDAPETAEAAAPLPVLSLEERISFYQLLEKAGIEEDTRTYMELRFVCRMRFPEISELFGVEARVVRYRVNQASKAMTDVYCKGGKQ